MKAKVLATDEVVEIVDYNDSIVTVYRNDETEFFAQNEYSRDEVEFLPDTEEVTIEGYVARGANPHHLALYERKPDRLSDIWGFSHSLQLDPTFFPEVTWDSEPKRVKITITPME
ncbi:MAG: hypothetical protein K2N25_03400 [Muribaculaceae bacterium]|nr:hypothetical protein [Muribaculaceae bacterium]